jgi:serine protease Do
MHKGTLAPLRGFALLAVAGFASCAGIVSPTRAGTAFQQSAPRGFIGIRWAPLSEDLATQFGVPAGQGALVAQVSPGGPAEQAQIKPGDIVLQVDGEAITPERSIIDLIGSRPPGSTVMLEVTRDGQKRSVAVILGTRPPDDRLPK